MSEQPTPREAMVESLMDHAIVEAGNPYYIERGQAEHLVGDQLVALTAAGYTICRDRVADANLEGAPVFVPVVSEAPQ